MAVSVAKGNQGVCTTDAVRFSVSRTSGSSTPSGVKSVTEDLRLAYPAVECNI